MRTPTQSALVEILSEQDVDHVFTLMSEEIIPLLSEIDQHGADDIRVINARHEQGAAAMADGFSRVDDELGVCLVGRGPAIAQTGTSLVTAEKNGSNVLYLVPEPALSTIHDKKRFEQTMYLKSTVGNVVSIRSTQAFVSEMRDAFRRVRNQNGPLAVQIPIDVLDGHVEKGDTDGPAPGSSVVDQSPKLHPDERAISRAVDLYIDSDSNTAPVVLAGQGTKPAETQEAIESLAEQLNAYLVTTIQARGYYLDYPYSLGFVGGLGAAAANDRLRESEFVFAIGCSLNPYTVHSGDLINEDACVVHIDTDRSRIGEYTAPTMGIHGDAEITSNRLACEIGRAQGEQAADYRMEQVDRSDRRAYRSTQERTDEPGRIDPEALVKRLDELFPADRSIVSDAGRFCTFVHDLISVGRDDPYIWTTDFVSIGQALPMAVGAALAGDDRACIAFCGDAGFMMSIQELETAVRYDIPIVFVVMNDGTLGAEFQQARDAGYTGEAAVIGTPEFDQIANGMGAEGYAVRSLSDLEALSDVLAGDVDYPVVVDCKIPKEIPHRNLS